MEEFSDYSGEASVGGRVDEEGVFVGACGSGRYVSNYIFSVRGYSLQAFDEIVVEADRGASNR